MLLKNSSPKTIQLLSIIGCVLVLIGLLFSKAILSLSTAYLVLVVIFFVNYTEIRARIKDNRLIHVFLLFILFYIGSLLWSNLIKEGLSDLLSKINLFLLPITLVALPPLTVKHKKSLLQFFTGLIVISSVINFVIYQNTFSPDKDIRTMSLFISHIRFSLFVVFGIFILAYQKTTSIIVKIVCYFVIGWLLFYTYYAQVLSGILALFICTICISIYELKSSVKWKKGISILFLVSTIFLIFISFLYFKDLNTKKKAIKSYSKYTKLGHNYKHDNLSNALENGYPLDCFINIEELDSTWKTRSKILLNSFTKNEFRYYTVLVRYLTSKGLTKDAEGVNKLTQQDIKNIEHGIPTILALESGLKKRIYELQYELNSQHDPNGHSILHRIEYWKTGWTIFEEHWIIGTGIGDYKSLYQAAYTKSNSVLKPKNRLESHNQFLGFLIATGIIGFYLFMLHIIFTFKMFLQYKNKLALLFFTICIVSFFVEDTLTTLAGMSFYAFFFGLFIMGDKEV